MTGPDEHLTGGWRRQVRSARGPVDCNIRAFWNWRFMFETMDVASVKALLPASGLALWIERPSVRPALAG